MAKVTKPKPTQFKVETDDQVKTFKFIVSRFRIPHRLRPLLGVDTEVVESKDAIKNPELLAHLVETGSGLIELVSSKDKPTAAEKAEAEKKAAEKKAAEKKAAEKKAAEKKAAEKKAAEGADKPEKGGN